MTEITETKPAGAALVQETRPEVSQFPVRHGPSGLPAGAIAARLGVPASTLPFHLAQVERAGLLRAWRAQRQSLHAVDADGARRLLTFPTEDCRQGHPDLCVPQRADAAPAAPSDVGLEYRHIGVRHP